MTRWAKGARHEGGAVLATVAMFLPVALLCMSLVVDLGAIYATRAGVYAAADMGALAAVQALDLERLGEGEILIREAEARATAEDWVRRNLSRLGEAMGQETSVDVRVYNTQPGNPVRDEVTGRRIEEPTVCVRVSAPATAPLFRRRVTLTVHADASVVEK